MSIINQTDIRREINHEFDASITLYIAFFTIRIIMFNIINNRHLIGPFICILHSSLSFTLSLFPLKCSFRGSRTFIKRVNRSVAGDS